MADGSSQQQQFVTTYAPYAQQAGAQLGVDPNVILGQWGHETGWGTNLGTQHNNLGGVTAPTGQYYSYADPQQFTDHYVTLLKQHYPGAVGTGSDVGKFVTGLYRGGYFTASPTDYVVDVNNGATLASRLRPAPKDGPAGVTPFDRLMSQPDQPPAPVAPAPQQPVTATPFDRLMSQPDPGATPPPTAPTATPPAAPAPAATPTGPVPPPIYTAPSTPLIRPGGDASTLSPDAQAQVAQTQAPMPAPTGQAAPVTTQEQANMGPGLVHGLRTAFNPLLESGASAGTWAANKLGFQAPWPTGEEQRQKDIADEAQFQAQYGPQGATPSPGATGTAAATRLVTPMLAGGIVGTGLRAGLTAMGAPATAAFVSGAGGQGVKGLGGLATRLASGATSGAIQGGIAGGAPGAVSGAVLGGTVLPAAGKVADWLQARFGDAAVPAVEKIYQALVRDRVSPQAMETALKQMGALGIPPDVAGANLKQLAVAVANTPGPASETAASFLSARAGGQTARLNDAVRTATGATGSAYDTYEALSAARQAAAAPRYEQAFSRIVTTPEEAARVQPFINDPIGQDALQRGLRIAQLEKLGDPAGPQPFNPADYGVTQGADGKFELGPGVPNLRLMDAVKRGYDDIVEGFRDPTSGKLNLDQYGRAVNQARASYVAALRDMYPRYANALDAWAGPSQAMDALSMGRRVLTTDPDVTAAAVAKLPPAQQDVYRVGVAQALKDKIDSTPDTTDLVDATRRIFGNQAVRDKVAASFGGANTPEFQNFQQAVEREAAFAATNRRTLGGSRTAPLASAMFDLAQPATLIEPGLHALSGNLPAAGASLLRQGMGSVANALTQPSERVNEMLGRMLYNPAQRATLMRYLTPGQLSSLRNSLTGWPGQQAAAMVGDRRRRLEGTQP